MDMVAGIDFGTSYFKACLFDRDGRQLGLGRVAVEKNTAGGKCELEVKKFWQLVKDAIKQACQQANASPASIKALAYSSQANSFILLDKDGYELTPLILWPDMRARTVRDPVASLWQKSSFVANTGIAIECGPGFCVCKLDHIRRCDPDLWNSTRSVMTISDYFTFCLTGSKVGDGSTASLLGLYNPRLHNWWIEAFDILKLDTFVFSRPLLPGSLVGPVNQRGRELLNLSPSCLVAVGGLDHYIAAIGAGIGSLANISESTGTVLACLKVSDSFSYKQDCCTGPCLSPSGFYSLTFSSNGASVLEWYQQNHAPQYSIAGLIAEAQKLSGTDGLVAVECANEFASLDGFKNVKSTHNAAHFALAILESNSKTLASLIKQLEAEPGPIVATGGGAKSDFWLQLKANMLGRDFIRSDSQEPACRGAAMIAAMALGWGKSVKSLASAWIKVCSEFHPCS